MRRKIRDSAVIVPIVATCFLGVLLFDPAHLSLLPPCPFHALTGFYCPGCGSLRALHLLLHGELAGAFRMNPLLVLSLPVLIMLRFHRPLAYKRWLPWSALVVLVLYGIVRNIPFWPFVLITPH